VDGIRDIRFRPALAHKYQRDIDTPGEENGKCKIRYEGIAFKKVGHGALLLLDVSKSLAGMIWLPGYVNHSIPNGGYAIGVGRDSLILHTKASTKSVSFYMRTKCHIVIRYD
jgi:hypothetical protein